MEAFNYYTPVITSDIDNFKEVIRDKENGFMYEEPTNEKNLYQVMHKYYFEYMGDKDKITAEARKDLEEKFSLEVIKKNLILTLNNIIAKS